MAPRDGAHRIAVLVLEVIEQSDLVMEGGLHGPAVRAVGRAGDRVAVGEQPGARHRVAGISMMKLAPSMVAVSDAGFAAPAVTEPAMTATAVATSTRNAL